MPTIYWPLTVLVPYLALIGMFLFISIREDSDFFGKSIDFGMDASILGMGIWGALIGSQEVQIVLGIKAMTIGVPVLFFDIILVALSFNMKHARKKGDRGKALVSVLMAALIFGVNTALVEYVNENKAIWPAMMKGVAAWLIFFVGYGIITLFYSAPKNHNNPSAK